ncbi:MAG: zinc ribbon domain-containing protein [bacterium]
MALVKCADCGNEVSTSAASCPKCGAPGPTVAATQLQIQQQYQRLKPHRLGAAAAMCLGMLGVVGIMTDILPVDGDAGIFYGIAVPGLLIGGALWALVTIARIRRPQS